MCKSLRDVIDDSLELQYHIELAVDGLVDGINCPLSTADRLKCLLEQRLRWRYLDWRQTERIPVAGNCQAYELVDGMFAILKGFGSRHLSLTKLPSATNSTQKIEREDVGLRTRDFAMDPSQDLIAFVAFEIVGT